MRGPLVRVDMEAPDPAWRQIADQVRALLVSGRLRPGAQLATVRELAVDLGVNHNTVAQAYRLLAEEGFLRLERGVGAVVLERNPPRAPAGEQDRFARRLRTLVAEARAAGVPGAALTALLRKAGEEMP
jgi:DNA-binding transcriptional regulator YhcF (GntR family)